MAYWDEGRCLSTEFGESRIVVAGGESANLLIRKQPLTASTGLPKQKIEQPSLFLFTLPLGCSRSFGVGALGVVALTSLQLPLPQPQGGSLLSRCTVFRSPQPVHL